MQTSGCLLGTCTDKYTVLQGEKKGCYLHIICTNILCLTSHLSFLNRGKFIKKQTNKQTKPIKTQNGLKLELEMEKEGNPAQLNRLGSQASLPKQPILLVLVHRFIA